VHANLSDVKVIFVLDGPNFGVVLVVPLLTWVRRRNNDLVEGWKSSRVGRPVNAFETFPSVSLPLGSLISPPLSCTHSEHKRLTKQQVVDPVTYTQPRSLYHFILHHASTPS
jgi:hypothetical protein